MPNDRGRTFLTERTRRDREREEEEEEEEEEEAASRTTGGRRSRGTESFLFLRSRIAFLACLPSPTQLANVSLSSHSSPRIDRFLLAASTLFACLEI